MVPLGTQAPDFTLPDTSGTMTGRDDFTAAPALLVAFLCNHCPYVRHVETALGTLPARDAKVLRLYFGLDGGREHTLEEIGAMLGVTRERVRQLRDRALKRLREGDVGKALGSFAA